MTGPEHYREAERRLALAENMFGASLADLQSGVLDVNDAVEIMRGAAELAQVHATLALAAATALCPVIDQPLGDLYDTETQDALNDWHATVTIAAETPDLADDRQRRLVTDWLETYATDTNEDLDALLARIRRPSTQRAKPETSQVTPDGRSWGWLR